MKQKPKQRKRRHTMATKSKVVKGVNWNTKRLTRKREPWRVQNESLSIKAKAERSNI